MNKKLMLLVSGAMVWANAQAQQVKKCGIEEAMQKIKTENPAVYQNMMERKNRAHQIDISTDETASKGTAKVQIPIVFHIALTQSQLNRIGGMAGIAKRIDSQVIVLNRDYNKQNADVVNVPAVFSSLVGNPEIEFLLARTDPSGNSTPGYDFRLVTGTDTVFDVYQGTAGSGMFVSDAKYNSAKGLAAWDVDRYLNIWVVNIAGGQILGICADPTIAGPDPIFNPLPKAERGVVLTYGAFGKKSSAFEYYVGSNTLGRTLTHEVGHYFELDHIWGGNNFSCSDDDGINDTPPQFDMNYGCPTLGTVYANCAASAGGEMWMNYMDYVDDGCMIMFTKGQVARQKAQYDNNTKNSWSLTQNPHLGDWPAGVKDINGIAQLQVSPNPSNGIVLISFNAQAAKLQQVSVTNQLGQQVLNISEKATAGNLQLDLNHLPKGMYVIQCRFENGQVTKKLILQ